LICESDRIRWDAVSWRFSCGAWFEMRSRSALRRAKRKQGRI
jgi:hypothetical protein